MIHSLESQVNPGDPTLVGERYRASIPSGRYSTPEEIANMVVFLCSDLATNTTGGQFVVDGGRALGAGAVTAMVPEKQLCFMSSDFDNRMILVPRLTRLHNGIENRQQLMHTRNQYHFFGFAFAQKPVIEHLDDRVVANGTQGCHV